MRIRKMKWLQRNSNNVEMIIKIKKCDMKKKKPFTQLKNLKCPEKRIKI